MQWGFWNDESYIMRSRQEGIFESLIKVSEKKLLMNKVEIKYFKT